MEKMNHIRHLYQALIDVTNEKIAATEDKSAHADLMQDLCLAIIREVIVPLEYWTHYKGGVYMVVTVAVKEDTLEPVVVYSSLKYQTTWVRTVSNFLGMVTLPDGSQVNRFKVGAP